MSEKAMAREKYDSNEGWLEDVIMNAWLENDLKRKRELAHRGLAQEAAIAVAADLPPLRAREEIIFWYRNYRGEEGYRRVRPISLRFGRSDYHKEPQWLLLAFDLEKNAEREFALADASSPVGSAVLSFPAVQGEGRVPEGEIDYDDPKFNQGVTHTVELLAKELGVTDWVAGDGSEDYDEDLSQTLLNIIVAKGLYNEEDGSWAALSAAPPAPAPEGEWRPDVDEIARAICGHPRGCQLALGLCDQCKDDINVLGVLKAAARVAAVPAPPVAGPKALLADNQTVK